MNPTDALQLLDSAAATAMGSRIDHIRIQAATKALSDFLAAATPKVDDGEVVEFSKDA